MKITIVYRYFWPDTPPYAVMLREMSRWLAEAGHEVEVITAQPAYKPEARIAAQPAVETIDNVLVRRLPLLPEKGRGAVRAFNSGVFILQSFLRILFGKRRDLVWTATMPPVVQAALLRFAANMRGARFLYQMMDIYPEIGIASRTLHDGLLASTLKSLDIFTLNRTDIAVVLSKDMSQVLAQRKAKPRQVRVINNFALAEAPGADSSQQRTHNGKEQPVKYVFAGNIGRFQNLEALLDAFSQIPPDEAELHFVGEGRAKASLMSTAKDRGITNVRFLDHMPVEKAFDYMKSCDVGVVSLAPEIYRYAFPSKTLTYFAAGLPILAMVETNSELATILSHTGAGISVGWHNGQPELVNAIRKLTSEIRNQGVHLRVPADLWDAASARTRWLTLINELADRHAK